MNEHTLPFPLCPWQKFGEPDMTTGLAGNHTKRCSRKYMLPKYTAPLSFGATLHLFRPGIIKSIHCSLNNYFGMFRIYFDHSYRTLFRNKVYAFVKVPNFSQDTNEYDPHCGQSKYA